MFRLIRACFGGKVKFNTIKWNNYEIRLLPYTNNIRNFLLLSLIPYFWDSDVVFDLGIKVPKSQELNDDIHYSWELRDLDGQIVMQGSVPKQGHDVASVTNKGFRRKLVLWNSVKTRAVVLGNLHPHKEYLLYMKFRNDYSESNSNLMASFTIEDRTNYEFQMFLILFTIFASLFIAAFLRSCGMGGQ